VRADGTPGQQAQFEENYKDMTVAGLFAGIGGLERGFAAAGLHASLLSEVDPSAIAVLKARFADAPIAGDVAGIRSLRSNTTVITAGFPCQDLSPPGGKIGIFGSRSGLVSHVFRLAASSHSVEWLVLENVHFMLRLDGGRAMSRIVSLVEELGWSWAYRTVDVICVLPQRRRRVVLVASSRHDPRQVLFRDDHPGFDEREPRCGDAVGFYWTEGRSGAGLRREAVPTLKVGSGIGISSAPAILLGDGRLGTPTIEDAERLQGFPAEWTLPAEGMARSVRWRLVGNAVPSPLAEWVARGIVAPRPLSADIRVGPLHTRRWWPDAAFSVGGKRMAVTIGESFSAHPRPLLSEFLQKPLVKLSSRAIRGFVLRARSGGLHWPDGFLDKVEANA
jgi:DNA (cytosine-5)-methyltransferase 1